MTERESRPSMPPGWSVDETADARCHAIAALPPQAIGQDHLDALIDLLRDRNWRVRREAALAVARVRDPLRPCDRCSRRSARTTCSP